MSNCPRCGVKIETVDVGDGRCFMCGTFLPGTIRPYEMEESVESTTHVGEASTIPKPERPAPRSLSNEFRQHVTNMWEPNLTEAGGHEETINPTSGASEDPEDLKIGTRSIGSCDDNHPSDYELIEEIGKGKQGAVWAARQSALDRIVAIKIPNPDFADSPMGRQQFLSEVVVSGQLEHPNIVPIYDVAQSNKGNLSEHNEGDLAGIQKGQLFYSMKHVQGRPWNERIHGRRGKPLTLEENLEILMKVCDAVRFAHDKGIIHRDIKPHNIMVGEYGEVSVMDWGIAVRLQENGSDSRLTKLSPAGTPAYMAPEMATARTQEIGRATDIYLLGAVLFEILTGQPPHPPQASLKEAVLSAAENNIIETEVSGELMDYAYKALETNPQDRYESVEALQDAIRTYRSHAESVALANRAEAVLREARSQRDNDLFARSRFAFEEAIELWPANGPAKAGLEKATLAYAENCLRQGDYGLGVSLLDRNDPGHRDLLGRLRASKRRRDGARNVARGLAVVVAALVVFAAIGGWVLRQREHVALVEAKEQRGLAETRAIEADEARELADQNALKAKAAQTLAEDNADKADAARMRADDNAIKANDARMLADERAIEAVQERQRAEEASYAFEIGLASENVQRNAFDATVSILDSQLESDPKREARGWEWGHLRYLATQGPVERFRSGRAPRLPDHVESVALSSDARWAAAGTRDGKVFAWDRQIGQPKELQYGAAVNAVAISPDGRYLAAAGAAGNIQVWSLPEGNPLHTFAGHSGKPVNSLDFSYNGDTLLSAGSDRTARIWSIERPSAPALIFRGHREPIWTARFSADGERIVTASDDRTVRIWNTADQTERNRLDADSGIEGPVYAAAFSPDGSYVVSGGADRALLVWRVPEEADEMLVQRIRERVQNAGEVEKTRPPVLGKHAATIRSLSFAGDGGILASAGQDNTVRIWDFKKFNPANKDNSHLLLKTLRGHGGWVTSCVVSKNGSRVLSGARDERVWLWNWRKAMPFVLRRGGEQGDLVASTLTSAAYSPNGQWIVTSSKEGDVTVWDMRKGMLDQPQQLQEGHAWLTTSGHFFAGGARLLTSAADNSSGIWNVSTGDQLAKLGDGWKRTSGTGWRGAAAVSDDGKWIATGSNGYDTPLLLWDAATGELAKQVDIKAEDITAVAFSPDNKLLFAGDARGNCSLITIPEGVVRSTFPGHAGKVTAAVFADSNQLLTASWDGTVAKWDVVKETPERMNSFSHGTSVLALAVGADADGRYAVTGCAGQTKDNVLLRRWNIDSDATVPVAALTLAEVAAAHGVRVGESKVGIRSVAIHPETQEVLTTVFSLQARGNFVGSWGAGGDLQQYQPRWEGKGLLSEIAMAKYSDDGGSILLVGGTGGRRVDLEKGDVIMRYQPQKSVRFATFSASGERIICAGSNGTAKIWRLEDGVWKPGGTLDGQHKSALNTAFFHPKNENVVLTASDDNTASLWTLDGGVWTLDKTLKGHTGPVLRAEFSPDGSRIVTASADGSARLWDAETGQPDAEPLTHSSAVNCASFSPNGKRIITAHAEKTLLWDAESGKKMDEARFEDSHSADITSLAYSPDGRRLLTASKDFTVKLWDVSDLINGDMDEGKIIEIRELLSLEEHSDQVTAASFSRDGLNVLTAGHDGQAMIWPSVKIDDANGVAVQAAAAIR